MNAQLDESGIIEASFCLQNDNAKKLEASQNTTNLATKNITIREKPDEFVISEVVNVTDSSSFIYQDCHSTPRYSDLIRFSTHSAKESSNISDISGIENLPQTPKITSFIQGKQHSTVKQDSQISKISEESCINLITPENSSINTVDDNSTVCDLPCSNRIRRRLSTDKKLYNNTQPEHLLFDDVDSDTDVDNTRKVVHNDSQTTSKSFRTSTPFKNLSCPLITRASLNEVAKCRTIDKTQLCPVNNICTISEDEHFNANTAMPYIEKTQNVAQKVQTITRHISGDSLTDMQTVITVGDDSFISEDIESLAIRSEEDFVLHERPNLNLHRDKYLEIDEKTDAGVEETSNVDEIEIIDNVGLFEEVVQSTELPDLSESFEDNTSTATTFEITDTVDTNLNKHTHTLNCTGLKKLMSTPKPQNANDDLSDLGSVKQILGSSKKQQRISKNDLDNTSGVKYLFQTPKLQLTPNVEAVKRLFKTPNAQRPSENRIVTSNKDILANNDICDITGVKNSTKTPETKKTPQNDISEDICHLFTTLAASKMINKEPQNIKLSLTKPLSHISKAVEPPEIDSNGGIPFGRVRVSESITDTPNLLPKSIDTPSKQQFIDAPIKQQDNSKINTPEVASIKQLEKLVPTPSDFNLIELMGVKELTELSKKPLQIIVKSNESLMNDENNSFGTKDSKERSSILKTPNNDETHVDQKSIASDLNESILTDLPSKRRVVARKSIFRTPENLHNYDADEETPVAQKSSISDLDDSSHASFCMALSSTQQTFDKNMSALKTPSSIFQVDEDEAEFGQKSTVGDKNDTRRVTKHSLSTKHNTSVWKTPLSRKSVVQDLNNAKHETPLDHKSTTGNLNDVDHASFSMALSSTQQTPNKDKSALKASCSLLEPDDIAETEFGQKSTVSNKSDTRRVRRHSSSTKQNTPLHKTPSGRKAVVRDLNEETLLEQKSITGNLDEADCASFSMALSSTRQTSDKDKSALKTPSSLLEPDDVDETEFGQKSTVSDKNDTRHVVRHSSSTKQKTPLPKTPSGRKSVVRDLNKEAPLEQKSTTSNLDEADHASFSMASSSTQQTSYKDKSARKTPSSLFESDDIDQTEFGQTSTVSNKSDKRHVRRQPSSTKQNTPLHKTPSGRKSVVRNLNTETPLEQKSTTSNFDEANPASFSMASSSTEQTSDKDKPALKTPSSLFEFDDIDETEFGQKSTVSNKSDTRRVTRQSSSTKQNTPLHKTPSGRKSVVRNLNTETPLEQKSTTSNLDEANHATFSMASSSTQQTSDTDKLTLKTLSSLLEADDIDETEFGQKSTISDKGNTRRVTRHSSSTKQNTAVLKTPLGQKSPVRDLNNETPLEQKSTIGNLDDADYANLTQQKSDKETSALKTPSSLFEYDDVDETDFGQKSTLSDKNDTGQVKTHLSTQKNTSKLKTPKVHGMPLGRKSTVSDLNDTKRISVLSSSQHKSTKRTSILKTPKSLFVHETPVVGKSAVNDSGNKKHVSFIAESHTKRITTRKSSSIQNKSLNIDSQDSNAVAKLYSTPSNKRRTIKIDMKSSAKQQNSIGKIFNILKTPGLVEVPINNSSSSKSVKKVTVAAVSVKQASRIGTPAKNDLGEQINLKALSDVIVAQTPSDFNLSEIPEFEQFFTSKNEPSSIGRTPWPTKPLQNHLNDVDCVKQLFTESPRNYSPNVQGHKHGAIKKKQSSPKNDLRNIKGVKRLMKTPRLQKTPVNDLRNVSGVKRLLKTPLIQKSPKNDLSNVQGVKQLLATKKKQKSPKNDLCIIRGVKSLMKTPCIQKAPLNDLSDVSGVKRLIKTPTVHITPRNDLRNIQGKLLSAKQHSAKSVTSLTKTPVLREAPQKDSSAMKRILRTPAVYKSKSETEIAEVRETSTASLEQQSPSEDFGNSSMRKLVKTSVRKSSMNNSTDVNDSMTTLVQKQKSKNDLSNGKGMKQRTTRSKVQKSPLNDLTDVGGVKQLLKTPSKQKSPENDLSDVRGVKQLLGSSRKLQRSPKNDLTGIVGVKKLFRKSSVLKSPLNDLSDVRGVKTLMRTPKVQKSPKNTLENVYGVKKLFNIPRAQKSPKNDLTNIRLSNIFQENDANTVESTISNQCITPGRAERSFDELINKKPLKTYPGQNSPDKSVLSPHKLHHPIIDNVVSSSNTSPYVEKWVESVSLQNNQTTNKTGIDKPKRNARKNVPQNYELENISKNRGAAKVNPSMWRKALSDSTNTLIEAMKRKKGIQQVTKVGGIDIEDTLTLKRTKKSVVKEVPNDVHCGKVLVVSLRRMSPSKYIAQRKKVVQQERSPIVQMPRLKIDKNISESKRAAAKRKIQTSDLVTKETKENVSKTKQSRKSIQKRITRKQAAALGVGDLTKNNNDDTSNLGQHENNEKTKRKKATDNKIASSQQNIVIARTNKIASSQKDIVIARTTRSTRNLAKKNTDKNFNNKQITKKVNKATLDSHEDVQIQSLPLIEKPLRKRKRTVEECGDTSNEDREIDKIQQTSKVSKRLKLTEKSLDATTSHVQLPKQRGKKIKHNDKKSNTIQTITISPIKTRRQAQFKKTTIDTKIKENDKPETVKNQKRQVRKTTRSKQ